jgi:hypothetical protein
LQVTGICNLLVNDFDNYKLPFQLTFFSFSLLNLTSLLLLLHRRHHANSTMTSREETVLAPTDPSITDENDWWEFGLTDVKVLKPGKMLYANLLDATEQNPVQVIGCLEPLREDQEHLGVYRCINARLLSSLLTSHSLTSAQPG